MAAVRMLLLSLFLMLVGCVPRAVNVNVGVDGGAAPLSGPAFDFPSYGRVGIVDAEMYLYDVSVGGIFEFRDDWSRSASAQAVRSAALTLKKKEYSSIIIPEAAYSREMFQLKNDLRYHCTAFQNIFFGDDTLSYHITSANSLGDRYGVDGFLYIYGFEEKFSDKRRQFLNEGVQTGMFEAVPNERVFVALILTRKDGRILWYKHILASGNYDMRREAHAMKIMEALFE